MLSRSEGRHPYVDLRGRIAGWLKKLETSEPGRFRFCLKGDLLPPGVGTSALALKLSCQIDSLATIPDERLHGWIEFIQSYQKVPGGRYGGLFEDREHLKRRGNLLRRLRCRKDAVLVRWAETRQACAALMAAGAAPIHRIEGLPQSQQRLREYLNALPWEETPWGAGSHASHRLFLLRVNELHFGGLSSPGLVTTGLDFLDNLQDPVTGCWFRGSPSRGQIINGAMKVITAYAFSQRPIPNPERIVDYCLTAVHDGHACNVVDVSYVLYHCQQLTEHRHAEVSEFAHAQLETLKSHERDDGAFSFYPNRSGTSYYGAPVSLGLPVSDLHGTHLLVWALTMLASLLGFEGQLGCKLPVT